MIEEGKDFPLTSSVFHSQKEFQESDSSE